VPYRERPDVDFFVDLAREAKGRVLEIGCGTGRVLIPTARAGIEICGLDTSPAMLEVCRRQLDAEPAAVRGRAELHEGDMRAFDLAGGFALVTMPFRPFQYMLTVEDQLACLGCVHRHLRAGGRVVVDLFNPNLRFITDKATEEEFGDEPEFTLPDGRRVLRRLRLPKKDLFHQINDVELIHHITHPDGRTERAVHAFRMRYFFRYEIEHLLARAGFRVDEIYADFERRPYGSSYPGELIVVAGKA